VPLGTAAGKRRQAALDALPPQFEKYLTVYLDSAGLLENPKPQANAYAMFRRRGIGRKSQSS
jgi:hypothetical protein